MIEHKVSGHKCFISYKTEDNYYKIKLDELFKKRSIDVINKSLDYRIDSNDSDYIMQVIRNDYLKDSTVTIFLIGKHSSENEGYDKSGNRINYYIEHELQASLYNGKGNTRNGILGIVLPEMMGSIYVNRKDADGNLHHYVNIMDSTVIREFSVNYYTQPHAGNGWPEDERYCILVPWDDFIDNPESYIQKAFDKRFSDVAGKIKIRNLR